MREPRPEDGPVLWKLAGEIGLDVNSAYAYLLVSSHWAPTSVVAELEGEVVGFVAGYRPPTHQEAWFCWQVGVGEKARGRGLARKMILEILARDACLGVRWVEATVTSSNTASQKLFASVARALDTDISVAPHFSASMFPGGHEPEELHRIGPFARRRVAEGRDDSTRVFREYESEVRSYCRSFPVVFDTAREHLLVTEGGKEYIDFFTGAGVMAYGHNPPQIRKELIAHLERGGLTHGVDLYTATKRKFLERFVEVILKPRDLDYRIMFPGPTGTNAVEAAMKLARLVTGRETVVAFTRGFHGMTLGALSITGNETKRTGAGVPLPFSLNMPYDGYFEGVDTVAYFEKYLEDSSSGVDLPAAVIVETVQGEGGVNVASFEWLRRLEQLCRRFEILLIVDDIQVGCGRTGPFFSFEPAGIKPDVVTLSKALSGYGLPFALTLIRPDLDIWEPARHNGTFRGHQPAMVTAAASLDAYWRDDRLSRQVAEKGAVARERLEGLAKEYESIKAVRGRGLILGIELTPKLARALSAAAFERGVVVETSGASGEVLKLLPPLTIETPALEAGLEAIAEGMAAIA